jgi:transposase
MEALMARFDLTDAEWTIIAPLLPDADVRRPEAHRGRRRNWSDDYLNRVLNN